MMNEQTWVNPKVDRSSWPAGEWDNEPFDKVQWVDESTGLACLANRHSSAGNWCGYVGVGPDHPWHGKSYDDVSTEANEYGPDVHGGLTYAAECEKGTSPLGICHIPEHGTPEHLWWFGFDCAHAWDFSPQDMVYARDRGGCFARGPDEVYRSIGYVKKECSNLAAQIAAVSTPPAKNSEAT